MRVRVVAPEPRKEKWYEPVRSRTGPRVLVSLEGAVMPVSVQALHGNTAHVQRFKLSARGGKFVDMLLLELLDGELAGGTYWAPAGSEYLEVVEDAHA